MTTSGESIKDRILHAIRDEKRTKSAIYIGKASEDLKRRPAAERAAYSELNQNLNERANSKISYRVEILEDENHYGMSISGIEHGLEVIYPFDKWNIPYRDFWNSENPASEIKDFYDRLSTFHGFEILPLEDSFYAAQTLSGTARRLQRQERKNELAGVLKLWMKYYPNSPEVRKMNSEHEL